MRARIGIAAAALAAVSLVPAAPAQAADSDCIITGPNYVGDAVDCAIHLYTILIGW